MKAIKLCLSLLSVTSVLGLGTKYHLNPDKVYGKGPAFEQKVRDEFAERNSHLNGYAELVESNYTQKLDHFNNTETRTWPMRWLIDNSSYDATNGTILFYAGNEGGIYTFYNNSGFMTETLAKEMNATVIFAEHRYYGTSMPFGADSFKKENLRWLNVQQVMEDYVALLDQIKMDIPSLANKATIAFGGSYGGMLAAWMRMKYPHKIQGALASSAPVLWFRGAVDANAYTRVASKVIKSYGEDCYGNYSRGFYDLTNMQYDSTKYQKINDIFNLCKVPTKASDINNLIASISDSLGTMAMVNYPYDTNFVNPLPAWPQ
jgi:lysosomal Pro-X carboxypeptidase